MRILFDIGHPAHVHLFKNVIKKLEKDGHQIKITARDKDLTYKLLDIYGFTYECMGTMSKSQLENAIGLIKIDLKLLQISRKFKPDLFVSTGSPYAAQVSFLMNKPHIAFSDSEPASIIIWLSFPFTKTICTPSCFRKKLNPNKHIMYDGYKELAYLHPNNFSPNPSVLSELGLKVGDPYIIIRFVSWTANHDIGQHGIKNKTELVHELEKYGKIFITSEGELDKDLEKYKIKISPEKIHDVLYYAKMLIGDSQTMTTEAGILGTPAIRSNTWVGENDMGNFVELQQKYQLIYSYYDQKEALAKAIDILETNSDIKKTWNIKRKKLIEDKLDVSEFITWFIETYPKSYFDMKKNPKIQDRFKGKDNKWHTF